MQQSDVSSFEAKFLGSEFRDYPYEGIKYAYTDTPVKSNTPQLLGNGVR